MSITLITLSKDLTYQQADLALGDDVKVLLPEDGATDSVTIPADGVLKIAEIVLSKALEKNHKKFAVDVQGALAKGDAIAILTALGFTSDE